MLNINLRDESNMYQIRNCFYLSIRCETIMTRPIEHDKVRDALFFQLEPILSAFERAYHIDPEDSFEAIHILEKLLEERLKTEKGYDSKKIDDFKKHAELEINRLRPRASDSIWK
jgi:hypothetical protein